MLFRSLSHPYGMQFAITNNVPPLITTNSNIIMTLDGSLGVDINQSLTVEQNISISGYSSFYAPITTNITCNKSLYVSGGSILNSTLFVSGSTTLNSNLYLQSSSLMSQLRCNNTHFSLLVSSVSCLDIYTGLTYLNSDVYCSTSATTKRFTLETTSVSGTPYFTFKARGNTQSSLYQTNGGLYIATETANLPIRMTVTNGTTTFSALTINSNGTATFGISPLTVVSTTYTSDERLKENIEDVDINDCFNIFNNIGVKTFSWKNSGQNSLGNIAQLVE